MRLNPAQSSVMDKGPYMAHKGALLKRKWHRNAADASLLRCASSLELSLRVEGGMRVRIPSIVWRREPLLFASRSRTSGRAVYIIAGKLHNHAPQHIHRSAVTSQSGFNQHRCVQCVCVCVCEGVVQCPPLCIRCSELGQMCHGSWWCLLFPVQCVCIPVGRVVHWFLPLPISGGGGVSTGVQRCVVVCPSWALYTPVSTDRWVSSVGGGGLYTSVYWGFFTVILQFGHRYLLSEFVHRCLPLCIQWWGLYTGIYRCISSVGGLYTVHRRLV